MAHSWRVDGMAIGRFAQGVVDAVYRLGGDMRRPDSRTRHQPEARGPVIPGGYTAPTARFYETADRHFITVSRVSNRPPALERVVVGG